jgi:hypothetical protein
MAKSNAALSLAIVSQTSLSPLHPSFVGDIAD